jgi:hypothetical protein
VARLIPLQSSPLTPRILGLGKGKFTLPNGFDAMNASEIQDMFETGT